MPRSWPAKRAPGAGPALKHLYSPGKRGMHGQTAGRCAPLRRGAGRQTKNRRIPRLLRMDAPERLFSPFLFDPKNGPEQAGQTLGAFYHDHLHPASLPFGKMGRPACRAKAALPPRLPHYIQQGAKRCGRLPGGKPLFLRFLAAAAGFLPAFGGLLFASLFACQPICLPAFWFTGLLVCQPICFPAHWFAGLFGLPVF